MGDGRWEMGEGRWENGGKKLAFLEIWKLSIEI